LGIDIDDLTSEQYALLQALEPADLIAGCNDSGECDAGYIDFGRLPGEGIRLYIGKTPILEWLKQWSNIYQVRRQTPESRRSSAIVWANGRPVGKWTHQAQGGYVEEPVPGGLGFADTVITALVDKAGDKLKIPGVGFFRDLVGNVGEATSSGGPGTMHFRFTYIDEANGTGYIREIVVDPASQNNYSMMVDQSWIPILYDKLAAGPPYINDLSWLNTWTNRYYEE
jgi:hypothetical protein